MKPNDMPPNSNLRVTRLTRYDNAFGPSYMIRDDEGRAMWGNSRINQFILATRERVPFNVHFKERDVFHKDGADISYTPVVCSF